MSYSDLIKQNISRYEEKDYADMFSFYREVWPDNQLHLDEKIWEWKFLQNPNNPDPSPPLWIYKRDGKIKGQIASIPFLLKVKDRYIPASWGIDLIVSEEYRMKGLGPLLAGKVCENTGIFIALGVTEDAYRMFRRMQLIEMKKLTRYVYVLNYKPYLKGNLRQISSNLLSPFVHFIKSAGSAGKRRAGINNITMEKLDGLDDRITVFWEKVSVDYDFAARRDASYLTWRYLKNPYRKYDIFELRLDREMLAYCITRIDYEKNVRVGYIVDFLAKKKDINTMLLRALKYFKEMKVDSIVCDVINRDIEETLTEFGFSERESARDLMLKINRPGVDASLITEKNNWFVTRGDSDMDYTG